MGGKTVKKPKQNSKKGERVEKRERRKKRWGKKTR